MNWKYYLSHPVAASVVFGLVMVILSFIDAKINGVDRTRNDYIKLFVLVTGGTLLVIYFTSKRNSFSQLGGSSNDGYSSHHHHRSSHHSRGGGFDTLDVDVPDF
jgi:hypothetical protein